MKIALIVEVPGTNRVISPRVLLADIARKLGALDLTSGSHVIAMLDDGSLLLDGAHIWTPRQQPRQTDFFARLDAVEKAG